MIQRSSFGAAMISLGLVMTVVIFLTPFRVIVRGDDFGYVESVAETIRQGRLVGSDWLEPFNFILPAVGICVFGLTGSFWLATMGLNIAIVFAALLLLREWLSPQDVLDEIAVAMVALTPIWLNKAAEFTGVPAGIALTLAALVAWKRQHWIGFFVLVLLGCANRQSSVCLLAIPLVSVVRQWRERSVIQWKLLVGLVVVALSVLIVAFRLPPTFARRVMAENWITNMSIVRMGTDIVIGLVCLGGCRAGWSALRGESPIIAFRKNIQQPLWPLALSLGAAWLALVQPQHVHFEPPVFWHFGALLLLFATLAGAWLTRWNVGPAEAWACAFAYILLIALRGHWWDYYFLEPALVLAWGGPAVHRTPRSISTRWLVGALAPFNLAYVIFLGGYLRQTERQLVVYEQALRSGTLKVTEASDASFGYLGWKLFATACRESGSGAQLADFLRYVEGGRADWSTGELTVNRKGARRSIHPTRENRVLPADWRDPYFPLNDIEWRGFVQSHDKR